jgi:hypothetical protein
VLFLCKNGEHRSFYDVYYIPRLTMNIVSVGKLDETGYDIHIQERDVHSRVGRTTTDKDRPR